MAAKKTRNLVRTGLTIAATTLAEAALQEAAENPRVRRKAKALVTSTAQSLKRAVRKVTGKRARKAKPSRRSTVRKK